MDVNTGPKVQFQPDKQKSFFLFVQSCFIDKILIVSELLFALVPQINKIIKSKFIIDLKVTIVIVFIEFLSFFFGHLIQVEGNEKYVTI